MKNKQNLLIYIGIPLVVIVSTLTLLSSQGVIPYISIMITKPLFLTGVVLLVSRFSNKLSTNKMLLVVLIGMLAIEFIEFLLGDIYDYERLISLFITLIMIYLSKILLIDRVRVIE